MIVTGCANTILEPCGGQAVSAAVMMVLKGCVTKVLYGNVKLTRPVVGGIAVLTVKLVENMVGVNEGGCAAAILE